MTSAWRRSMAYLGLVDDEDDDYAPYDDDLGGSSRFADAPTPLRSYGRDEAATPMVTTRPSVIRTVPASSARVHIVDPTSFNDAQEVGDRLKSNQPVVLNLQGLDRDLQRRMIDFCSGVTYALAGSMSRVADQVFLLTPTNVEVSQEEKERLQARGLYQS